MSTRNVLENIGSNPAGCCSLTTEPVIELTAALLHCFDLYFSLELCLLQSVSTPTICFDSQTVQFGALGIGPRAGTRLHVHALLMVSDLSNWIAMKLFVWP